MLVKTEDSMKEGLSLKENRFFIEGKRYIKYNYNNGHIANDPKLAVNYFLHALEKIPALIENHQKHNEKLSVDLPVLQEIAQSVWRKEDELNKLKSELSALDRQIQLSLKPVDTGEDTNMPEEFNRTPLKMEQTDMPDTKAKKETQRQGQASEKMPEEQKKAVEQIHAIFSKNLNPQDVVGVQGCESLNKSKGIKL